MASFLLDYCHLACLSILNHWCNFGNEEVCNDVTPKKFKPFKDRKATIMVRTLASQNLHTNRTRLLFKPSKEAKSLLASI